MENLYLVVGLGNPGADYAKTRHNAGFLVAEQLASRWRATWSHERKFGARLARAERGGLRAILCEPQTYMNASGEAVGGVMAFYRVPLPQVMVVVDDADLPLGQIRMRPGGSSGGHHGLESVEQHLDKVLDVASDQVETWLDAGIQKAMSQFNGVVDGSDNERKEQ